jgi:predicted TIM-barrel fold metal-dependent hydrolase
MLSSYQMKSPRPRSRATFDRRRFLATATLAAAAAAVSPLDALAQSASHYPAIDTHIHFYDPTRPLGVPWPPKEIAALYSPHLPKLFQSIAAPLGVVGAVVIEASEWVEDNQWVLDLIKDEPMIVGYIGNLPFGQPAFGPLLERFAKYPLFRGVRLRQEELSAARAQGTYERDLQQLGDHRFTLDVVGGPSLLPEVLRIAKLVPAMRVVIDHLPYRDGPQDAATLHKNLAPFADLPNVYAKISDVPRRAGDKLITDKSVYQPRLDALCECFGINRVIYGSNWPVGELMATYAEMHHIVSDYFATRGKLAAEKFFWRNSRAAYSWIPRGQAKELITK